MKKEFINVTLAALLLCTACTKNSNREVQINDKNGINVDSRIVLFDVKNYTRKELAQVLDKLRLKNPKVVGIDVRFESLNDNAFDTLLAESIGKLNNVLLSKYTSDDMELESNIFFTRRVVGQGAITYLADDQGVLSAYVPLIQNRYGQSLSFPSWIAYQFGRRELFASLIVNEQSPILIDKGISDFLILTESIIDDIDLKDKIVLFGSLGNANDLNEVSYTVKLNNEVINMPSIVVSANVINKLIEEK